NARVLDVSHELAFQPPMRLGAHTINARGHHDLKRCVQCLRHPSPKIICRVCKRYFTEPGATTIWHCELVRSRDVPELPQLAAAAKPCPRPVTKRERREERSPALSFEDEGRWRVGPQSFCTVPCRRASPVQFSLLAFGTEKDRRRTRGLKSAFLTGAFSAN